MRSEKLEDRKVKKFFGVLCGLFILGCNFAAAFENGFFIGVEPLYSLQNGTLYEYVIAHDENSDEDVKMSELDWSLKNISYIGGRVNAGWKFINLSFDYEGAFSKESGEMIDLDWLDRTIKNNLYYYNDTSKCTTKSINENTLKNGEELNLLLKFDINPVVDLHIIPYLGYRYSHYKFSGRNGYGWYGQSSAYTNYKNYAYDDSKAQYYGKGSLFGIDYERQTEEFVIGTSVGYTLFDRVSFGGTAGVSPYIKVQSVDYHHSNSDGSAGTYFYDVMEGFFCKFDFGGYVDCKIVGGLSADLTFNYELQNKTKGITYRNTKKSFSSGNKIETKSASEGKTWKLTTGVKYTF